MHSKILQFSQFILIAIFFFQVVIFVKSVQRCTALAQLLTEQNFPAIGIHRGMTQEERLTKYQSFKDFQQVCYTKKKNRDCFFGNNISTMRKLFHYFDHIMILELSH